MAITSAPEPRGGRSDEAAAAVTAALYARHRRLVFGLCRGLLRDRAEAEDAAQQVFLSAHRSLLNGAEPREPAAWLATIARNECRSRIGARMREPLPTEAAEAVVGAGDPPAEALRRADVAALWRELRRLPRAQRDAFLLRELAGLRYDELAVALSVTEPAVESLLVRARSRLRAQLQRTYGSVAPAFRFLLGNGTSALAAKAAAVGLGAAAVTGGAAPVMLVRHHLRPPAPKRHRVTHERRPAAPPAVPTVAPVLPARVVTTTAVEPERHRGRADERREGSRGFGPPDGRHGSGSSGPGPGDASGEGPGSGGSGSSGSGDSGSSGGRGDDGDG